MQMKREYRKQFFLWLPLLLFTAILEGCIAPSAIQDKKLSERYLSEGRNYTFAIYNNENRLVTHPLKDLAFQVYKRKGLPISDIYIVSHGWGHTVTEAIDNYQHYIDFIDQTLDGNRKDLKKDFQPYFIFVVWPSLSEPTGDLLAGILPFGLDKALAPATDIIDHGILFPPSAWKQSIDAKTIGRGGLTYTLPTPKSFHEMATKTPIRQEIGREFPVSSLISQLLYYNENCQLGKNKKVHIHGVGHSYGAKLIAYSFGKALPFVGNTNNKNISCSPLTNSEPPIHSLILINPAMQELEFSFGLESVLDQIKAKAILFSNFDYATGAAFDISQVVFNNNWGGVYQSIVKFTDDYVSLLCGRLMFKLLKEICSAPAYAAAGGEILGLTIPISIVQWTLTKTFDFIPSLAHHTSSNPSFNRIDQYIPGIKYGLNFLHYFFTNRPITSWGRL